MTLTTLKSKDIFFRKAKCKMKHIHVEAPEYIRCNLYQYMVGKEKDLSRWKFLFKFGKMPPSKGLDLRKKIVNNVVVSGFTLQIICRYPTLIIV